MSERSSLVLMALAAEVTFLVVALIPLLPFTALLYFFYGAKITAIFSVAGAIFMWWLWQPDAMADTGHEAPKNSPLRPIVDDLCKRANAPPIHKIVLTDELNAAAYQSRGFFSLFGVKRTLYLGVPLIRLLSDAEIRAVIAHELGHFSRQHGRMGHWVYKVRSKWDRYLFGSMPREGFVDITLRSISKLFVPQFVERSTQWSLRCEYEADAVAAQVVNASALAQALTKLEVASYLLSTKVRSELNELCKRTPEAPANFWDMVAKTAATSTSEDLDYAVSRDRKRPSRMHDTHPRLDNRVAALGLQRTSPDWNAASAGETLIGAAWPNTLSECDARWKDNVATSWHADHLRLQWLDEATHSDSAAATSTKEIQRAHAIAAEEFSPSDESLAELKRLSESDATDAGARYDLASALLAREDAQGVPVMREAIKLDKRLAVRGHGRIRAFLERFGTDEEAAAARERLQRALIGLEFIERKLWDQVLTSGQLEALPASTTALLTQALLPEKSIDGCWLLKTSINDRNDLPYTVNVMVARLDLSQLPEAVVDEDKVRARLADAIAAVTPPSEQIRIHTVFTSEPLNPHLLKRLEATTGACLRHPVSAINADIVKIDSL